MQNATFNILTPFPGTRLFEKLESEGRILTRDWTKYNGRDDVVFTPRHMSADELLAGFRRASARFYSARSIARRLSHSPVQLFWTLPLNAAYAFALHRSGMNRTRAVLESSYPGAGGARLQACRKHMP